MYRIPLRLSNVDLEDDETLGVLGEHLADMLWSRVGGRVLAVLYTDCKDPVGAAIQAVRRIQHTLPTAAVHEVDLDLVGVAGIAGRAKVSREAVRLWVEGRRGPGNFPPPAGAVGEANGRLMKLWRWPDVSTWLEHSYGMAEEDRHLSREQIAAVNASICRVKDEDSDEWCMTSPLGLRLAGDHPALASESFKKDAWAVVEHFRSQLRVELLSAEPYDSAARATVQPEQEFVHD